MKLRIKKLDPNAKVFKTHESDFCYDVVATSVEEVAPDTYMYGLGIAVEIDGEFYDELIPGITSRPRSSIYKTGMLLTNAPGTIDQDYRGEIKATFYHIMKDRPKYEVGDRVVQIHFDATRMMDIEIVEELSDTERGTGGHGSTGK